MIPSFHKQGNSDGLSQTKNTTGQTNGPAASLQDGKARNASASANPTTVVPRSGSLISAPAHVPPKPASNLPCVSSTSQARDESGKSILAAKIREQAEKRTREALVRKMQKEEAERSVEKVANLEVQKHEDEVNSKDVPKASLPRQSEIVSAKNTGCKNPSPVSSFSL